MKILCWNIRGMNASLKKQVLADLVKDNNIDIVAIRETKKESFTDRTLHTLSTKINRWDWLPSKGRSGGILFGCDSSQFDMLHIDHGTFSLSIGLKDRTNNIEFLLTIVYGPVDARLKNSFWLELQQIRNKWQTPWLLCGDFNAIRYRTEKSSNNFDLRISRKFNKFINDNILLGYELNTRKFTWTNGLQSAMLDRFIASNDWDNIYKNSTVQDLVAYCSDHCPLVLTTTAYTHKSTIFRYDSLWAREEHFVNLVHRWWADCPLHENIGYSWDAKMKYLKKNGRMEKKF